MIRITPPTDASDRRVKVFNYIDAIRVLPTNFTAEERRQIMSKVNPRLYSRLRETFTVIDDDDDKVNSSSRRQGPRTETRTEGARADAASPPPASTGSGPVSGSNRTNIGSKNRGNKRGNESSGLPPAKSNRP